MYVITNRHLLIGETGLDVFGDTPNPAGPNELRLLEVTPKGKKWDVKALDDEMDDATKQRLQLDPNQMYFASQLVAHEVVQRARKRKRHVLLFVHGFNNGRGVYRRARTGTGASLPCRSHCVYLACEWWCTWRVELQVG
jgi:esterase/lipase superfamily enzyme